MISNQHSGLHLLYSLVKIRMLFADALPEMMTMCRFQRPWQVTSV